MGTKKKEIKIPKKVKFLGKRYKLEAYYNNSCFCITRDEFDLTIKINEMYNRVYGDISINMYPNEFNASIEANSDSVRSVIDELERSVYEYFENLGKFLGYEIEG
jgi:hypothetical protein